MNNPTGREAELHSQLSLPTSNGDKPRIRRKPDPHADSFSRSPRVLARIFHAFSYDGDIILNDGRRATVRVMPDGRREVYIGCFDGKTVRWYYARLLYYLRTGELPPTVDHRNGDPTDNRFATNLRAATYSQNAHNRKRRGRIRHPDLPRYVYPRIRKGKKTFEVIIPKDGKQKSFGRFDTVEEADAVAREISKEISGPFHPGIRYRRKRRAR